MPYIGLPLYHRRFPRVRADHRTSLGEDRRRRVVILVQKNFLSIRGLLGVGNALFHSTTASPSFPLPGVSFPSDFFHMDSHQADRRGSHCGSPFGSGFPIGASSSPVGTRLCLQSLVCYTFAGQLLPSESFVLSLTHNHNCMYQQKVPGGASRFATRLPAFLLSGKGI